MALSRTLRVLRLLSAGLLAGAATIALPGTAQAAGTWHNAIEVPNLGTLNNGSPGHAQLGPISCPSAGNCSAGGNYTDSSGNVQAFVVDEVNGTWHNAQEQPGTAALNHTLAGTGSISCFSAGNCSAGGSYSNVHYFPFAFVADRVSGAWHSAKQVPGMTALSVADDPPTAGAGAFTESVSCRTGANCSAVGAYRDSQTFQQVFAVNRVSGTWQQAHEIPGTGALNAGGDAFVESVSCGSAGNCSTGGQYLDGSNKRQAWVANRVSGTWKSAIELPGTATLNVGGDATVVAVSCGAALTCSAIGTYTDGSNVRHAFVANRVNGTWHAAFEAPGVATLGAGHNADLLALSCPSAGNCSAAGDFVDSSGHSQGFVISEVNGHWGNAIPVPGLAALNTGNLAQVRAVSCSSAGNCTAGGQYFTGTSNSEAFVVDEVNGVWGNAVEVPGIGPLNAGGDAMVNSVSCATASACSAGGIYVDAGHNVQAFLVNKS